VVTITISHRVNVGGFALEPTLHAVRWPDGWPVPAQTDRIDVHDVEGELVRGRVTGRTFTDAAVMLFVEEAREG
jgi:hypothetical protein